MHASLLLSSLLALPLAAYAQLSSLENHVDVLDLNYTFNPVKPAYWTSLPHHRRTPFALSPDGQSAYLAYLDSSETDVHVIELDPTTFAAKGTPVTVTGGKEAGGLVAQNDGFALLTNVAVTGTNAPPSGTPVPVIVRYTGGEETWRTFVAGPGVHASEGLSAAPDLNGDLVYSESADMYGAYFVVTDYQGDASGHFGDSIEYVNSNGTLQTINGASSAWGCSHNTGIAFEAAAEPPFASICAEDHGSIWLNTATLTMGGRKIAGENVTNGASGEPMGGMSGSYSSLANFPGTTQYIFAWRTRGCVDLTQDTWMGQGFTQCDPRMMNGNVAISLLSDKETLKGAEAISTVGAAAGDSQLNWLTRDTTIDRENVHVAAFDDTDALVTWEEISSPHCDNIAMGCSGTFAGAYYQLVNNQGEKIGDPISSTNTYVAGDMVNIGDRLCWPYVSMTWDLSAPVGGGLQPSTSTKMSFACISNGGNSTSTSTTPATSSSAVAAVAASSAAPAASVAASSAVAPIASSAAAASSPVAPVASSVAATTPSAPLTTAQAVAPTTLQTVATPASSPAAADPAPSEIASATAATLPVESGSPASGDDSDDAGDDECEA